MSLKFCKSARASHAIEASGRGAVAIAGVVCSLICVHMLKVGIISRIYVAVGCLLALCWGAVVELRWVRGHDEKEELTSSLECSLGVGKSVRVETAASCICSSAKIMESGQNSYR
jgi:hypothetical protein